MSVLFTKVCIYDDRVNKTILYGQSNTPINNIIVNTDVSYNIILSDVSPDFIIILIGKIHSISQVTLFYKNSSSDTYSNIILQFPFEACSLSLNKDTSTIVSTICKDYSYRLEEWIRYNLMLGVSGIIIFNNNGNTKNGLNEPTENCIIKSSMEEICAKYKDQVMLVDFPYSPLGSNHWNNIQRISLHIGVNAFRHQARYIALIDADEFIYFPKAPTMKIDEFMSQYNTTITIRSNILTNKAANDVIDNNILQIAEYVGEDKYTKTILDTRKIQENEFINTPHEHPTETRLSKEDIIHYHTWINKRCPYNSTMPQFTGLKDLYNSYYSI